MNPSNTQNMSPNAALERGTLLRAATGFALLLLSPALLFVAAGTTDWPMAWIYLLIYLTGSVGSRLIAAVIAPELLRERARSLEAENIEPWDRRLMPIVGILGPLAMIIVAGLDHRNAWSPPLTPAVQVIAVLVVIAGFAFSMWAFLSNRFFSASARIQTERGQTVIDRGPYRLLRHPGYAGGLLWYVGTPLMLGALWALVPALLTGAALILRTALEDAMLHDELPGYAEYARRVRSRLIPGVW